MTDIRKSPEQLDWHRAPEHRAKLRASWTPERKARQRELNHLMAGRKRRIIDAGDGTARVELLRNEWALIDSADIPLVEHRSWHKHSAGYAVARTEVSGKMRTVYMHRVICPVPPPFQVDHINGNRLDNRRSNLRPATHVGQRANAISRPGSASRFRGVYPARGKAHPWTARVRGRSLGAFATEEEAAKIADQEMLRVFGVYARLNFPEEAA